MSTSKRNIIVLASFVFHAPRRIFKWVFFRNGAGCQSTPMSMTFDRNHPPRRDYRVGGYPIDHTEAQETMIDQYNSS